MQDPKSLLYYQWESQIFYYMSGIFGEENFPNLTAEDKKLCREYLKKHQTGVSESGANKYKMNVIEFDTLVGHIIHNHISSKNWKTA